MNFKYEIKVTRNDGEVSCGMIFGTKDTAIHFVNLALNSADTVKVELLDNHTGELLFLYCDKQIKWFG